MRSERLTLREFHPNDAPFLFALNKDVEVMRFTGDVPFGSIEEAKEFIQSYSHYRDVGYGRWLVEDYITGEQIGWCGLKFHPEKNYTDLGFRIKRAAWNKGYATESGQRCIDFAREFGLKQLVGRSMVENLPSIHMLKKLGFKDWQALTDDLHCGTIGYLDL